MQQSVLLHVYESRVCVCAFVSCAERGSVLVELLEGEQ